MSAIASIELQPIYTHLPRHRHRLRHTHTHRDTCTCTNACMHTYTHTCTHISHVHIHTWEHMYFFKDQTYPLYLKFCLCNECSVVVLTGHRKWRNHQLVWEEPVEDAVTLRMEIS